MDLTLHYILILVPYVMGFVPCQINYLKYKKGNSLALLNRKLSSSFNDGQILMRVLSERLSER